MCFDPVTLSAAAAASASGATAATGSAAAGATLSSLAASALAASLTASATGAYGTYQAAKAENKAAEYNASIMGANADLAEIQAKNAEEAGALEEKQHRQKVSQLIGKQRAAFGASGAVVDTGSALDVTADTAALGEMDAMTIRKNTRNAAWGYRTQGRSYQQQAKLARLGKRNTLLYGGSTLLTGMSKLMDQYTWATLKGN